MLTSDSDRAFLNASLTLAEQGLFSTTPNPRVGCLLVKQGRVVGRGFHHRQGKGHAEVEALKTASVGDARGATAYVSLEPCSFQGQTGPCTRALIAAGVSRVVCAMQDPHPRVSGSGIAELKAAGIEAGFVDDVSLLRKAQRLNCGYVNRVNTGIPWVRLKMAASLDGRTAMASGESKWITGSVARSDVQYWRARSCAIVTGIGTVLADDPKLSVREDRFALDGVLRQPLRVVLDHELRIQPDASILAGAGSEARVLIVTRCRDKKRMQRIERTGIEFFHPPGACINGRDVLVKLGEMGCNEVLVEAGANLMGHFVENRLWQEALIYFAPKFMGSSARPLISTVFDSMEEVPGYHFSESVALGEDIRLIMSRELT